MKQRFDKPFTQQEAIADEAIASAVEVLRTGRLHRYNTVGDEAGETALWEREYASYQGADFCLATTSGGTAMQIALRAVGVAPEDKVLTNAFTLAPVPGAIAAVGAKPIFVETTENLTIDFDDLKSKIESTNARVLMLSHMRGHIAPMEQLCEMLEQAGVTLIEDCAHTMGATWNGTKSGNFGAAACFSTQTYKHLNSGEGGLLTTSSADIMARATVLSGSYMLYERHLAAPGKEAFEQARLEMPNCSSRMDNLRAAILRPQLPHLDTNIERWNDRYRNVEAALSGVDGITLTQRPDQEHYVGSSFQFLTPGDWTEEKSRALVAACADSGVEIKWFGAKSPAGFTSRYDSWTYAPTQKLEKTLGILARVMDLRIPLSFSPDDCTLIGQIIANEFTSVAT